MGSLLDWREKPRVVMTFRVTETMYNRLKQNRNIEHRGIANYLRELIERDLENTED